MKCKGIKVRVYSQYQGLKHGELLHQILSNRFVWFDSFKKITNQSEYIFTGNTKLKDISKIYRNHTINDLIKLVNTVEVEKSLWELYEINHVNHEIYLSTEYGSLYIPVKAILNSDYSIIENRMITYFNEYYKNRPEYIEIGLKALESKEAVRLNKLLTQNNYEINNK